MRELWRKPLRIGLVSRSPRCDPGTCLVVLGTCSAPRAPTAAQLGSSAPNESYRVSMRSSRTTAGTATAAGGGRRWPSVAPDLSIDAGLAGRSDARGDRNRTRPGQARAGSSLIVPLASSLAVSGHPHPRPSDAGSCRTRMPHASVYPSLRFRSGRTRLGDTAGT
jgi:hypothetical protein